MRRALARTATAAVVLAGFALPFERATPVVRVGGIGVTTAELPLYVAVLLGGALVASRRPWRASAPSLAAAAWAVALLASAWLAPVERTAAIKFALRQAGGAALFVAASEAASTGGGGAVAAAFLAGAALSALLGIAESALPGVGTWLLGFKAAATQGAGGSRASGTLQYATIAAMFWESALVLGIGLASDLRGARRAAAGAACAALSVGLVLTGSRAGVGVAVALSLATAVSCRRERAVRNTAVAIAGLLLLLAGADVVRRPLLSRPPNPGAAEAWFRARYVPELEAATIRGGETAVVRVAVRNVGTLAWSKDGAHPIRVGAVWRGSVAPPLDAGPPAPLVRDGAPGDEQTIEVPVTAPGRAGTYILEWRLVQDGVAWADADDRGSGRVAVRVSPGTNASAASVDTVAVQRQPTRLALWEAGIALWRRRPLLGVGPDNFRHLYWRELGPRRLDERVHANNTYVETLADTGLVGLAASGLVVVALAVAFGKAWREDGAPRGVRLGAGLGVAAFLLHGCVDFFLPFTATYGAFWLLAALASGGPGRAPSDRLK